ncbi:MAG: DNA-3-methyladenine glycosylase I [Candidatus Eremiobacteraeota bacterium]|nr:DNA-3-methyladenine glycosylase I [Candidatus Eremiobacteraeota bacterium]
MLKLIDPANAAEIGSDEVAAYVRRYSADHQSPADDRDAFARLCTVIFAQGIGYNAVRNHRAALDHAFDRFDPLLVAAYDARRIEAIMSLPIIANRVKVSACVENAKRWKALCQPAETYLGRVARCAAQDDAVRGWPDLVAMLRGDFVRVGEITARQVLKRWGFFGAFSHAGAQRCIQRLGLIDAAASFATAQRFFGSVAELGALDPYVLETSFVLFATVGPCRAKPLCLRCPLADACPAALAADQPPDRADSSIAAASA